MRAADGWLMVADMKSRRLASALAAALLLAAPAAAQSGDPVTDTMVSTLDLCLRVLQGQSDWKSGLDNLGYRTVSSGGRVKPVGGTVIASAMGNNTMGGASVRLCEITASPGFQDKTALRRALVTRSRGLPGMADGPIKGGGVMGGYADMARPSGLIVLAVTDRPGSPATTSVSVIWK